MAGRAFAVGACYMYGREFFFRPAKEFTEHNGIGEILPVGGCSDAAEHGQLAE